MLKAVSELSTDALVKFQKEGEMSLTVEVKKGAETTTETHVLKADDVHIRRHVAAEDPKYGAESDSRKQLIVAIDINIDEELVGMVGCEDRCMCLCVCVFPTDIWLTVADPIILPRFEFSATVSVCVAREVA